MGKAASKEDNGLLKLKIQRDQMVKYRKKLEFQIDQNHKLAQQHIKNKKLAIHYLAQKKHLGKLIEQVDAQQMLLFEMISEIELKSVQVHVVEALAQGNTLLTSLNVKLKDADKVMDDLKDLQDIEIFDAVDYSEELEELEKMQNELLPSVPVVLPDAPKNELVEDDNLKAQKALAN
eukprot:NODE_54_length_30443_cov_1.442954.p20 type:complete len:177 gc:universal NODE_54_length_30443_cov_1.442954:10593-10063(-)